MADTYEAFYNGKPLNPNRGLPTMTYAQAEDCGLTESERLWCRTDGEDTPITADDIPYDSNTSVKDKLDVETVMHIDANTYSSYKLALNSMKASFDSLSSRDKLHSCILRNGIVLFRYNDWGVFSCTDTAGGDFIVDLTFKLDSSNSKFLSAVLRSTGVTFNDSSENAQAESLDLVII